MKPYFHSLALGTLLFGATLAQAATANVALNAKAFSNGPLYGGWSAGRITDGDRQSPFHGDATLQAGFAYWIDLGKDYTIDSIRIYPRQDGCCPDRLTNFRVSVHNDNGAGDIGAQVWGADFFKDGKNPGSAAGALVTISKDADAAGKFAGRWVKITALSNPVPSYALQINEVEVLAQTDALIPVNQTPGSIAYSNRPLYGGWNIAQIVDGSRNNVTHGNVSIDPGFAYDIDLRVPVKMDRIDIFPRQDGCCSERLTNFRVSVHKDAGGKIGDSVWKADFFTDGTNPGSTSGSKVTVTKDLDPAGTFEGQWVRILSLEDPVQNYALQMNEVEVYGTGPLLFVIAQQPQNATGAPGRTVQFRVVAAVKNGDDTKITYQWQKNGANIEGATLATYTTPPLTAADEGAKFRCIVSYPGQPTLNSSEATIGKFNFALGAAAFSNRPLWLPGGWNIRMLTDGNRQGVFHGHTDIEPGFAYEVNLGTTVLMDQIAIYPRQDGCCPERFTNLRVSVHKDAEGKIGDSVWKADLFTDGTNPGSTAGTTVTLTNQLDATGKFEGQWIRIVSLEDPVQNYALQMNELEVYGKLAPEIKLVINQQPQEVVTGPGKTGMLSVSATVFNGDAARITYQWQRNGVNIEGATLASYTTPPLTTADEGAKYRCVISYLGVPSQTSSEAAIGKLNWAFGAKAFTNRPLWLPGGWNISMLTDGNRRGVFHGHTDIEPGFAYEVDLGTVVKMEKIEVWARQDGCCPERLTNYRVSVHDDDSGKIGKQVWAADLHTDGSNPGAAAGSKDVLTKELDAAGKFEGRWIRILSLEDPVQNYALQMNELEVYGSGTIPLPPLAPLVGLTRVGADLELKWTLGVLESANDITGPWTAVVGAISPLKVTPSGNRRFYRLKL